MDLAKVGKRPDPPVERDAAVPELPPSPYDGILRQLVFHAETQRGTVVGLTSAVRGEGKTASVAEIARRLSYWATRDRPVLTVDCGQLLAPNHPALADPQLRGQALQLRPALIYRSLQSLQATGMPTHGAGLAGSLDDLRHRYSFVVLDLPPLLGEPIALELAREVDRLYLVVRAGSTGDDLLEQAVDLVGHDRIEGVILNHARPGLPGWLARLVS